MQPGTDRPQHQNFHCICFIHMRQKDSSKHLSCNNKPPLTKQGSSSIVFITTALLFFKPLLGGVGGAAWRSPSGSGVPILSELPPVKYFT